MGVGRILTGVEQILMGVGQILMEVGQILTRVRQFLTEVEQKRDVDVQLYDNAFITVPFILRMKGTL